MVDGKLSLDQRPATQVRMGPAGQVKFVEWYSDEGELVRVVAPPSPYERDGTRNKWACQALRYREEIEGLSTNSDMPEEEKVRKLLAYVDYEARPDEEALENGFGYTNLWEFALSAVANLGTTGAIASLAQIYQSGRFREQLEELVPVDMLDPFEPVRPGEFEMASADDKFGVVYRLLRTDITDPAFQKTARSLFSHYPEISVSATYGKPVWTAATMNTRKMRYDAIRFRSPPGDKQNLYFGFACPTNQSPPGMYIIPLVGDMKGFSFSQPARRKYGQVPWPDEYEVRLHQLVDGNIGSGRDYFIWLRFPDEKPCDMYFGIVVTPDTEAGFSETGMEEGLGLFEKTEVP